MAERPYETDEVRRTKKYVASITMVDGDRIEIGTDEYEKLKQSIVANKNFFTVILANSRVSISIPNIVRIWEHRAVVQEETPKFGWEAD